MQYFNIGAFLLCYLLMSELTSKDIKIQRQNQLKLQFISFRVAFMLADLFVWSFYMILLYRETQSFVILLLDSIINFISIYIGIIIGGPLLDKGGYLTTFRFANILLAITSIFILIFLPQISVLFIIFAIIRGFPRGIHWAVYNTFTLREMKGKKRDRWREQ